MALTGHRFTDFQVNEITQEGKVVHLRSIGLGEEEKQVRGIRYVP